MSQEPIPFAEPADGSQPGSSPPGNGAAPPPVPRGAGREIDEGRGRVFPCGQCGADLTFHIGSQSLKCPYCGHIQQIVPPDKQLAEQDFEAMLRKLQEWRAAGVEHQDASEVRCVSCGANVVFVGTLTSSECPYCASPIQRDKIHNSPQRVPVDGVLPFAVNEKQAVQNVAGWVRSRWFAPNDFRHQGINEKMSGVYLPFWTFDTMTSNRYSGQRGDYYYVTTGSGNNQRRERRTRWTPVSGNFQRFFDDVLVLAGKRLHNWIAVALEPWPLQRCVPFTPEVLAGFLAQTYDIPLDQGFTLAKERIDQAIAADVRGRIGGDTQRVDSIKTWHAGITYKHLILPVWLLAYRYRGKVYQVAVNAGTGEVQGERPYSVWKIATTVVAVVLLVIGVGLFVKKQQQAQSGAGRPPVMQYDRPAEAPVEQAPGPIVVERE